MCKDVTSFLHFQIQMRRLTQESELKLTLLRWIVKTIIDTKMNDKKSLLKKKMVGSCVRQDSKRKLPETKILYELNFDYNSLIFLKFVIQSWVKCD